jgi:hypothetical protein
MRWLVLCSFALLCGCDADKVARLEKENKELRDKLDTAPKTASLDLQEKCAKQARIEFNAGWNKPENHKASQSLDFTNHYNSKYGKCFMETTLSSTAVDINKETFIMTQRYVEDAFEGKSYADFAWRTHQGKKYWEVPPTMCTVRPIFGQEVSCTSTDEFDSLIKQFMEE